MTDSVDNEKIEIDMKDTKIVDGKEIVEEIHLTVETHEVALPETRTGKVDIEGDFHADQDNIAHKPGITFDTVAVPEFHTGKCPDWDPHCQEATPKKKKGSALGDLARMLASGGAEK